MSPPPSTTTWASTPPRWASTVGSSVATWPLPPGSSSLSGRSGSNFAEETHRLQSHRTKICSTNNSNFIVQPGTTKTSVTKKLHNISVVFNQKRMCSTCSTNVTSDLLTQKN